MYPNGAADGSKTRLEVGSEEEERIKEIYKELGLQDTNSMVPLEPSKNLLTKNI